MARRKLLALPPTNLKFEPRIRKWIDLEAAGRPSMKRVVEVALWSFARLTDEQRSAFYTEYKKFLDKPSAVVGNGNE